MKLIYLSSYNIPTKNVLGMQITQMCDAFAKNNVDVELIVPKNNKKEKNIFEYYNLEKNFKVKEIYRLELSKFGKMGFFVQTFIYLFVVKIYLFSKKNYILYTREQLTGLFFKNFFYEAHHFPEKVSFFHKFIFRRISKVIATVSFIKKGLVENGVISDNIFVSSNAVDLSKFNNEISKENARNKLNLPQDRKIIGYSGKYVTFGKGNKGVNDLINAFPKIFEFNPKTFLLIVGVGEDHINEIENLLEDLKISKENYKIISHLPHEEVIYALRASDLLTMNYSKNNNHLYYTSPIKMFEYMASERPIVASDLPSVREILNEKNAIFVEPNNIGGLIKGIKILLQNRDLSDEISEQAYKDVQNYTWSNRAKKILEFVKKI